MEQRRQEVLVARNDDEAGAFGLLVHKIGTVDSLLDDRKSRSETGDELESDTCWTDQSTICGEEETPGLHQRTWIYVKLLPDLGEG